ncbi:hypothetical protein K504DRAFT_451787 [Pleomassaria siparia CBS 279.74]|uniref:Methyltransferase type 11 domain-containing protein n=1 Tax=Pleomassaria siparia CBS 279.74 TaxID=1314801 RepID=A0A6G1JRV2_9PLEO|nr:hypothetical protein K504DRAFT_451787 [Pleomassaria siparia CBS 279.74]
MRNELFNDWGKFSAKNVLGDVLDFDASSEQAKLLDGKMDVVWRSAVIHQFTWDKQIAECKRLVQFSKGAGSLIVGCGVGRKGDEEGIKMQERTEGKFTGTEPFKHNAASTEKMWRAVGSELGMKLKASAKWSTWEDFGCQKGRCDFMGPDMGVVEFTVELV